MHDGHQKNKGSDIRKKKIVIRDGIHCFLNCNDLNLISEAILSIDEAIKIEGSYQFLEKRVIII